MGAPQQQPAPRPAMLLLETGSTLLYVDDEDVSGFTDADLDELAAWWEKAAASVVARSGPLPDVDGNGKFIIFFTHALGPRSWCLASAPDVWYPAGTCDPADTSGWTWSNGADMIHLHPPFGMEDDLGRPLPVEAQWAVVKGQMPFALQRMVDAARFGRTPPAPFATEIKHARMALAATLAGSGDHVESLRALAAPALLTRGGLRGSGPYPEGGYPEIEIFPFNWDAPHQEAARAAADTFLLYFADRLGAEFVQRFLDTGVGIRQFEVVSGIPFPIAFALWTGALLFSNEPASPWRGFDYTGTTGTDWAPGDPLPETSDWTPFHEKFQRFEYAPLEAGDPLAVNLPHVNSFDVLVTGVAGPGGGTVTVSMEEMLVGLLPRSPYVLAIPFQGSLP